MQNQSSRVSTKQSDPVQFSSLHSRTFIFTFPSSEVVDVDVPIEPPYVMQESQ